LINYTQYNTLEVNEIVKKINDFIDEDIPNGDMTTNLTVNDNISIEADIVAMDDMIFAGEQIIPHCFNANIEVYKNDGDKLRPNDIIGTIKGDAKSILSRERVMLNIIQRLSGIATHTKKYVDLANPFNVKILDTRKTTPGMRMFEKYAVKCGGGYNHRFSLSDGILIKDNHIESAGSIENVLENIDKQYWIELEVDTIDQIKQALSYNINGFLLDNMHREKIIECVQVIRSHPMGDNIFIEASGGINLMNITPYLDTGIDGISIGALTHQINSCDIKLEFK
tara:strand:- start:1274 stop:2119 length:846 start_codon:yes stop_codon:yes gene_type:complete